jgi:hypothetical protein
MKMRRMSLVNNYYVKLEKSNDFITLRLYFYKKEYADRFYIHKDDFIRIPYEKYCDIDRYALKTSPDKGIIYFRIYNGEHIFFSLPAKELLDWYNSGKEYGWFKPLEHRHKAPPKLIVDENSRLKEVLADKQVKNHFKRAVTWLLNGVHDTVRLSYDFVPYSFMFTKYKEGKQLYYGGLIYHNGQQTFSVCLDSRSKRNPYSIHT